MSFYKNKTSILTLYKQIKIGKKNNNHFKKAKK